MDNHTKENEPGKISGNQKKIKISSLITEVVKKNGEGSYVNGNAFNFIVGIHEWGIDPEI